MAINFVAIDIETANYTWDTMCAISLVRVRDGQIDDEYTTLINPECDFSQRHTHIHGITAAKVEDAPCFGAIANTLIDFIGDDMIVSHNAPFDMNCLYRSFNRYGIPVPELKTFCSLLCSKIFLAQIPKHTLDAVSRHLGIELKRHHDAASDARACAEIIIAIARRLEVDSVDGIADCLHIVPGYINQFQVVSPSSSISTSSRASNPYCILEDLRAAAPDISNEISMSQLQSGDNIVFKAGDSIVFYFHLSSSPFIKCGGIDDPHRYSKYPTQYKGGDWKLPVGSDFCYDTFISDMAQTCKDKYMQGASYMFGCCNDFIMCSDAKRCLKSDDPFYRGCQYRKNLESGHIFYGVNRNI